MAKKTRLTVSDKRNILDAIVRDIPRVDYDTIVQDYLNRRAKEQLPLGLQGGDYDAYLGRAYLKEFGRYVPNCCFTPTAEDRDFVAIQQQLSFGQDERILEVRLGVKGLIESFNYVEDFVAAAPEFARYVPKIAEPIVNLPAVQLTEKLHALGWPKSDEGK